MVTDRTKMVSKMVNMTRISLKIIVSGKVRCINNISLRGEGGANGGRMVSWKSRSIK